MRYLGSKIKLIEFIHQTLQKYNIEGEVFCDLFTGTSCVADSFKDSYDLITNDFMRYSYIFSQARTQNNSIPTFSLFREKYDDADIFDWLNAQTYVPNSHYFIYNNYTPKGGRMFFTESNAIKIDGIRFAIEELYENKCLTREEYYFIKASLIDCVTKYSNTSGTYEAYFKFWESRALKDFIIEPLSIHTCDKLRKATNYNENSNDLIRKISGDILYLDPPYTVTQYASAYNILETIALCDEPIIKGVGGKRGKGKCTSNYCYKSKAKAELEDILRQAQFQHIIISYSNQGVIDLDELIDLTKLFAKNHEVHVEHVEYQEYQNHRSSNKRNGQILKEVLIYFEKDLEVLKSPLNYAGSKDKMFLAIQKHYPKHIGTFVDVMGGAFNMGVNTYATNSVVYNDNNSYVYQIIEWLINTHKEDLIQSIEDRINNFHLGKADEEHYLLLRDYYNTVDRSPLNLFVLHMYAFQNYIRFNRQQGFNTPIGVAGYSEDIKNRIYKFYPRTSHFILMNNNFSDMVWEEFPEDTLFYFDPPYYITQAAYNDGQRGTEGWDELSETTLFNTLDHLNDLGFKFILSNVKEHKGKINQRLIDWANQNHYQLIDMGVSGWRYAKNEIIVKNY